MKQKYRVKYSAPMSKKQTETGLMSRSAAETMCQQLRSLGNTAEVCKDYCERCDQGRVM